MKSIKFILLFLLNLLIDLTVLSKFNIGGYIPSMTLPLIIVMSIYNKNEKIVYYSIIQGLFQDVIFGGILGLKALYFYLIAYYTFKFDYKKNYNLIYANAALIISIIFKNILMLFRNFYYLNLGVKVLLIDTVSKTFYEIIISAIILVFIYFIGQIIQKANSKNYI